MTRLDRLGQVGRAYDANRPPAPPPPNVASENFAPQPPEGTRMRLDFTTINDYIEFDGVRISRGGLPFQIGHHPLTPNDPEWRYALIAPGTDPVRFVIQFVRPVRGWGINGSSYVNGGVPAYPFAYTWFENPAFNLSDDGKTPNGDIQTHPLTIPEVHNKYKTAYPFGYPTGLITRAECGVYLSKGETDGWLGQPELNGFIGSFMTWQR